MTLRLTARTEVRRLAAGSLPSVDREIGRHVRWICLLESGPADPLPYLHVAGELAGWEDPRRWVIRLLKAALPYSGYDLSAVGTDSRGRIKAGFR